MLDLREPVTPPIELALVLGTLKLCGDCPSPVRRGGVGTTEADVSIGGGTALLVRCRPGIGGIVVYSRASMACTCLPYANLLRMANCGLSVSTNSSSSAPLSSWMSVSISPSAQHGAQRRTCGKLTDHVVAVLVADQVLQIVVAFLIHRTQDIDNLLSLLRIPELDTCLNHIASEFVLGVVDDVRCDQRDDPGSVFVAPMFDDVLGNVVAVLITDEMLGASMKFLKDGRSRRLHAML